jgi:ActR/RegA family two-component response regulator
MSTFRLTPAAGLATVMMFAPAPEADEITRAMLSRIVEAQAAAMEANDLASAGLVDHERYERAACDRDDAIDAAARFLGRP